MKLLVATTNPGKLREILGLMEGLPIDLVALDRWADVAKPAETGRTVEDNARLKALHYAGASGVLTVAEDSGLEIDALGGAPGVESARFGGADTSYPAKFALLYEALRARSVEGSTARFVCALAVADGDQIVFESRGTVEGRIAPAPRGEGGFGYDPIFFYPPFGCTLAEAGNRKSEVSHRASAFRAFREWLKGRTRELANW
jgi:XTP/dITP diphosphohydrolase